MSLVTRLVGIHVPLIGLLLAITSGLAQGKGDVITASPNPVPLGTGAGRTTITWSTADGRMARVVISVNGGHEVLFAFGPSGTKEAPWIADEHRYEFRLYDAAANALLASVEVRRGAGRSSVLVIAVVASIGLLVAAVLVFTILRVRGHSRAPRPS